MKLNMQGKMLKPSGRVTLRSKVLPSNGNYKKVTWSTSNQKAATVSNKGQVKVVKRGIYFWNNLRKLPWSSTTLNIFPKTVIKKYFQLLYI